jgi:hypothetical protein
MINDKFNTAYRIEDIEKVWALLANEWASRQVIEDPVEG